VEAAQDAKEGDAGKPLGRVRENIDQAGVRTGREDEQALVRQVDSDDAPATVYRPGRRTRMPH
jgi:hypothetical protein